MPGPDVEISVIFAKIVELAEARKVRSIKDLPGCWEVSLPGGWRFAVNGHREPVECGAFEVPPFEAAFWYNGWPAGIVGPAGGVLSAGAAANEGSLIAALDRAIAEACDPRSETAQSS